MSKFFESSIIREEMEDIFNIQKELYEVIMTFGSMNDHEGKGKLKFINKLLMGLC